MAVSTIVSQDEVTLWLQPDGPGTEYQVFGIKENAAGMTGKAIPGPGTTPVYGRDRFGRPVVVKVQKEAPGDLPAGTLQFYEKAQISLIEEAFLKGCPLNVQERIRQCGTIDNPNLWDKVRQWSDGNITGVTPGDAPSLAFDGTAVTEEATLSFDNVITIVRLRLTAQASGVNANLLSITGIEDEDCNECGNGYPGADQLLWIGAAAHNYLITANVIFTRNGGGAWALTSADPFAVGEDVSFIESDLFDNDTIRLIVGTGTVNAATKAQIARADVSIGDEGTTAWTIATITSTSLGDVIQALDWLFFGRLYIASAGDIYLSTDQGESVPDAAIYTGATQINGFSRAPNDREVYAFGNSNLILRELNKSGTFDTLVGPSGGGNFTALEMSSGREIIYAGNGQSLYKNTDKAGNVNNWTSLKDFGANKVVSNIQLIRGDSNLIRVVVDDTSGSTGEVWISVDGGNSFQQVAALTNTGYNDAYFSEVDNNLALIPGDVSGGTGVIHKLSPVN